MNSVQSSASRTPAAARFSRTWPIFRRAVGAAGFALLAALGSRAAAVPPAASAAPHHTYVIVHGAWGGGWAFREVDRLLTAEGHKVYRPTLTGQGEKVHLASPEVNLTTHVTDTVNVILFEDLHDVVLVGHSYGGMVITGVMDRVPERIRQVIFLDAAVPNDGESMNSLRSRTPTAEQLASGFIAPSAAAAAKPIPHDVPQPLKTWTEPVSFKNPAAKKIPGTVVVFVAKDHSPDQLQNHPSFRRAADRGWATLTLEGDHNAQWSHPKELADLLERIARGQ